MLQAFTVGKISILVAGLTLGRKRTILGGILL